MNIIYSIHLNHLYSMFLFLHLVCLHDNDDAVKNNPINVLFNHEEIALIYLFNWEDSTDFDHLISNFDIWKLIYIDFNGTGPQKNFDISDYPCFRYIKFNIYKFI